MIINSYSFDIYLSGLNSNEVLQTQNYIDLYTQAKSNENALAIDEISILICFMYSSKYLVLVHSIDKLYNAIYNSRKYLFLIFANMALILIFAACILFIVYSNYFFQFRTFTLSFIYSIKLFILIENTYLNTYLMKYSTSFTVLFFIFMIVIIKIFFFNVTYAVIIEKYRITNDKIYFNQDKGNDNITKDDELSLKTSKNLIFYFEYLILFFRILLFLFTFYDSF